MAKHAEELGFSDVWVSDHLALPEDARYPPSSYILEPLIALTWAAASTQRVGLGTSVLVLPLRPPVLLAKMLGSLARVRPGGSARTGSMCGASASSNRASTACARGKPKLRGAG